MNIYICILKINFILRLIERLIKNKKRPKNLIIVVLLNLYSNIYLRSYIINKDF